MQKTLAERQSGRVLGKDKKKSVPHVATRDAKIKLLHKSKTLNHS
jgi:hypothetical protein